jgi:hypothetical protein
MMRSPTSRISQKQSIIKICFFVAIAIFLINSCCQNIYIAVEKCDEVAMAIVSDLNKPGARNFQV